MRYEELKKHMIVRITEDNGLSVNVLVLPVTEKDIKRGMNAKEPGFCGFRGLWYKGNGTTHKSYGKIYELQEYDNIELVRNDIFGLSKKKLQTILK